MSRKQMKMLEFFSNDRSKIFNTIVQKYNTNQKHSRSLIYIRSNIVLYKDKKTDKMAFTSIIWNGMGLHIIKLNHEMTKIRQDTVWGRKLPGITETMLDPLKIITFCLFQVSIRFLFILIRLKFHKKKFWSLIEELQNEAFTRLPIWGHYVFMLKTWCFPVHEYILYCDIFTTFVYHWTLVLRPN